MGGVLKGQHGDKRWQSEGRWTTNGAEQLHHERARAVSNVPQAWSEPEATHTDREHTCLRCPHAPHLGDLLLLLVACARDTPHCVKSN